MRITAGLLRHRNINMTNLETTRETQDKVRMAIFNMLGQYFDGGVALDLFCGSGAMAIEAYSRGIKEIYLNDLNNQAIKVAKDNCKSLNINDAKFYNLDYKEFIKKIDIKFDLIFLDPPYKMDNIEEILNLCSEILNDKGIIIFEASINSKYPDIINDLKIKKVKKYGIKNVLIYCR